jgi:hypothetical protein
MEGETDRALSNYTALMRVLLDLPASEDEARAVKQVLAPHFRSISKIIGLDPNDKPAVPTSRQKPDRRVFLEKEILKTTGRRKMFGSFSQAGCLHKRGKNPVWYCTISDDFLQEDGSIKRGRRKIRLGLVSKLSEEEARQAMDQIVNRINAKTGPTNLTTVRRFIEDHFKPDVVTHLKKSGRSHYRWLMDRQIIPGIGDMKLSEVTLVHLQRLVNMKLETGLSVQTAKHVKGGLSAVFRHALALRVIEGFNPASAIRLPEMIRKERHTPTPEEARALIEVLRDPSYDPMRQMGDPILRDLRALRRNDGVALEAGQPERHSNHRGRSEPPAILPLGARKFLSRLFRDYEDESQEPHRTSSYHRRRGFGGAKGRQPVHGSRRFGLREPRWRVL